MAPRVVLRQPRDVAPAVEAVPGGQSVQRLWTAARPASASSDPVTSTSSVLSGHRRGTTATVDESLPRSTSPMPSGSGPSHVHASQTGPAGVDVDRLIEAIEERVLAEIERRGGRYAGLF